MNKPNLFIVGASKSGTTSLAQALGEHPSVFMTKPKEPDFFNCFDDSDEIEQSEFKSYMKLYSGAQDAVILGEASVSYLSSQMAAHHISRMNPQAKIVISLRNPLQRILSLYEMYVRLGLKQSFEYCTRSDPWLVRQCLYFEDLQRYTNAFPRNNVHIIEFSDIANDWDKSITSIHGFVQVTKIHSNKPTVRNVGGLPSNPIAKHFLNRKVIGFGKKLIPDRYKERVDKTIKRALYKKSKLSEQDAEYLIDAFVDDTIALDNLLGSRYCDRWFSDDSVQKIVHS